MKTNTLILLLLLTISTAFSQVKITRLKSNNIAEVPDSYVVGFINYYQTRLDMNADKNVVFLEYSRNYNTPPADTMFARMNINGIDVNFKPFTDSTYNYVSTKGTYKLKTILLPNNKLIINIYKNKLIKTIILYAKSFSG